MCSLRWGVRWPLGLGRCGRVVCLLIFGFVGICEWWVGGGGVRCGGGIGGDMGAFSMVLFPDLGHLFFSVFFSVFFF